MWANGNRLAQVRLGHPDRLAAIRAAYSAATNHLITMAPDGSIWGWGIATQNAREVLPPSQQSVEDPTQHFDVSPNGKFAVRDAANAVQVVDLENGQVVNLRPEDVQGLNVNQTTVDDEGQVTIEGGGAGTNRVLWKLTSEEKQVLRNIGRGVRLGGAVGR